MRHLAILVALAGALLATPAAEAGVVTIQGNVLRYDAQAGQNDEIIFTRLTAADEIEVRSPGTTPLSENAAACQPPSGGVVVCSNASALGRILATTLDGNDAISFSDLGSTIVGEADLGTGNDVGNVIDQAQPFRIVARGGPGRDTLIGGNLNDFLDGGGESDLLDGRGGPDDLFGGDGFDELHYDFDGNRTQGVRVTLDDLADDGAPGEQDNAHSDLEDLFGTDEDDVLIGNGQSNVVQGLCGADQITGGGGFDVLVGDRDFAGCGGDDTLFARDGLGERVNCGAGSDRVVSDDIDGVSECEINDSSPDAVLDRDADGADKPGDCNDADPLIKPGVFDVPDDGIDQNCDGADATDLDRDNDNFNRPQDCDDNRANVFPGADEIPGNGRDEDCNGEDAPLPRVGAALTFESRPAGRRTRFDRLTLSELRRGDRIRISCSRGCGVRTRSLRARRRGSRSLVRFVRGTLPAGARLDVAVSRANALTVVFRLTMRAGRVPSFRRLCLPEGARRPRACR